MSKLSQIQDILRSATIAEVYEFVKHFDSHLSLGEMTVAIGEKDESIVLYPVKPKGFKVVLYQYDTDTPFPKLQAIRIVREFTKMSLKEAKDHVESMMQYNEIPIGDPFAHRDMAHTFCNSVYLFDNKYASRSGLSLGVREA